MLENALISRQISEKAGFYEETAEGFPLEPKPSAELLNMISIGEKMVKQRRYEDAECVKCKVDTIKKKMQVEWEKKKKEKTEILAANFLARQRVELDSLRLRINCGIDAQKKLRNKELEK